ncbi:MAG: KamA family radical SAM protein [Bacteroidota bacterium]
MKYKAYTLSNYRKIPQVSRLSKEQKEHVEVVSRVFPFKTNNYVVDELIDWENFEDDPMFILNFPQRGMLKEDHYKSMDELYRKNADKKAISIEANEIRAQLNPHPAGQLEHNVPEIEGERLMGIQHKYRETALFFPTQGQTCHAYCTFCFRWPQFSGMNDLKFAMKQAGLLVKYLEQNKNITDILFTGGDPMIMRAKHLETYIDAILMSRNHNISTIRIGSKSLSFWPYRYLTDNDADEILRIFEKVSNAGIHLAFMAHFNHPRELSTDALKRAVTRIQNTGAQIRTQSPLLNHINNKPELWQRMWKNQVSLGMIPYYMFIARDTGAHHYFGVSLYHAWNIFRKAYSHMSGIARTVRGPSMSAAPGKVQVSGVAEIKGQKVFILNFLQGRNPEWVNKPFFAEFDANAIWLDDLRPAFNEDRFFYEDEYDDIIEKAQKGTIRYKEYKPTA